MVAAYSTQHFLPLSRALFVLCVKIRLHPRPGMFLLLAPKSRRICTSAKRTHKPFGIRTSRTKHLKPALFTSCRSGAMPQPIEVKSQSEQQSLPHLHGQTAPRCFGRKLAFDHREDGFYFGARTIDLPRKCAIHLVTDSSSRDAAARFGRNDAGGSQRAAHVAVIGFG